MTIAVANTTLSNTFSHWLTRVNELATAMSTKVVSTDSNTAVGNAAISGTFSANVISADTITASGGTINVASANLTIQATGGLITLGVVNIKNDITFDAVSKIRIIGANSTHTFLAANPATGNLEFQRILIPIDQITDVDTTNAGKSNTSILMWNTALGRWQTNTISLISSTTITSLAVGTVTSVLNVTGNTNLSDGTIFTIASTKRVGIGLSNPSSALHVNGAILATGDIAAFQTSDKFFKKNIEAFNDKDSHDTILQFTVKQFDWDAKKVKASKNISPLKVGHDIGLIAQDVQEILPTLVLSRDDNTLAVNYEGTIPYLIGAVKYLSKQVQELREDGN